MEIEIVSASFYFNFFVLYYNKVKKQRREGRVKYEKK